MSESGKTAYDTVKAVVDEYNVEIEYLYGEIGTSETELVIYDKAGERLVRKAETNMGDFVADAYLNTVEGAEIALVNGGGVCAEIGVGPVSRMDIMNINPCGNKMCVIKATGQQIVDALEHGARINPEPLGGFLQAAGLTYEIKAWRDSPVVTNASGSFLNVDETMEHRVENV